MSKRRAVMPSLEDVVGAASMAPAGSDLGPAVVDEFTDALGLQDLSREHGRRPFASAPAAAAQTSAPAPVPVQQIDFASVIRHMLKTVDAVGSTVFGIPLEDDADLTAPVEAITPYIQAHAADVQTDTALKMLMLSGVVGYLATKVMKYVQMQKQKPRPRPDVAEAADDHSQPVSVT